MTLNHSVYSVIVIQLFLGDIKHILVRNMSIINVNNHY